MSRERLFNRLLNRRTFIKTTAVAAAGLGTWPHVAHAADPLPPDRLMFGGTWEGRVGVAGGIPARTAVAQTLGPGATASQINSAIASCPADQVVMLSAGTYTAGGTIVVGRNNVTLRGAVDANGMPTTVLRNFSIVVGNQNGWDVANSGNFT